MEDAGHSRKPEVDVLISYGVDNSPSRIDWMRLKRDQGAQNRHLDDLMNLIGQEEVKRHLLNFYAKAQLAAKQKIDLLDEHCVVIAGNPGTGK